MFQNEKQQHHADTRYITKFEWDCCRAQAFSKLEGRLVPAHLLKYFLYRERFSSLPWKLQ